VSAAEAADGGVRHEELGGDLDQAQALGSQHENLVSDGSRMGPRHGWSPGTVVDRVVARLKFNHENTLRPHFSAR
jgi:hypothetical protein